MGITLPNAEYGDGDGAPGKPAESSFVEELSASMCPVAEVVRGLAKSDVPVLLLAESGAGKRATAQLIHEVSLRRGQPFQWLQCSKLKPEDLQISDGNGGALGCEGTLYLAEVADLSADCQARLRKAWSQPTGNDVAGRVGVRVICGSARDLEVEVTAGRLREDLYYRISGVCLRLPPLRQRKDDIPALMRYFLHKYAREFNREVPNFSAATLRMFQRYSWPGNLTELQYAARVLVVLGDEDVAMGGLRALLNKADFGDKGGGVSLKAASRAASYEAEKDLILKALTRTRWNRRRAARELQISYKALLYKLKRIQFEGYGAT